jgi:flagellar biosynthesis component FlhA
MENDTMSLKDLATAQLLEDSDIDQMARVMANMLEELVSLSERVAVLEGAADENSMQERIDAMIERVLEPFA